MPVNDLINAASVAKVLEGFQLIKQNNLLNKCFLHKSNPFDNITTLPGEIIKNHGKNNLTSDNVKEFMAASTLVHCMDGWTYLSNSVNAFLNGDLSIAIHLAYYAELRAAISFLASEGIIIANMQQVCVSSSDGLYIPGTPPNKSLLRKKTHEATWDIIEAWNNNIYKGTYTLDYFSYKGMTFKELLNYVPHASSTPAARLIVMKDWLKSWSFDIKKYKDDKSVRNSSSYNPHFNRNYSPISPTERLKSINNFWKSLDPSISAFNNIDVYLFSAYLSKTYDNYIQTISNKTIAIDKQTFIEKFFLQSGLTNDSILTDIFVHNKESDLIKYAKIESIDWTTGDVNPLSIIARSVLLLRFATGACSFQLKSHNITKADLDFYIDELGRELGIWDITKPVDFKDLWEDIYLLSEYFGEYLDLSSSSSLFKIRNELAEYNNCFYAYTQFTRASLWGLEL